MLRPNFVRSQVGDVQTFEKHVSRLIATIVPGQEVDLSERFFRLTIDSATEFLFGESTDSLIKDGNDGFSEAFTQSQDVSFACVESNSFYERERERERYTICVCI